MTPKLHLNTLFVLDEAGRILSTREPGPRPGPLFTLIRGSTSTAWAVRAGVPDDVGDEIASLASDEPPVADLREEPRHAEGYLALLRGLRANRGSRFEPRPWSGPAFAFPDELEPPADIVVVADEELLSRYFSRWLPGEIAAGRAPVMAVIRAGIPVSICFSSRYSDTAAEAGVMTARVVRGKGYAPRVAAAWALAIRASGRIPLYSTSWDNRASLAVARKLGLLAYASNWSLPD